MKPLRKIRAVFIICFSFIGCTDTIDLEFPPRNNTEPVFVNKTETALNSTELKLKGRWYLRAMSTADTTYQDSIYNRQREIEFTDQTSSQDKMPILVDNAFLALKLTPIEYRTIYDAAYRAPDSSTLVIKYSILYGAESTQFRITTINANMLVLSDSIQKKQWTFYR